MPVTLRKGFRVSVILYCCLHLNIVGAEPLPDKDTGKEALLSAVHSQELRSIMRRLNSLAYEREYTALELQNIQAAQINKLVKMADMLANTAEKLPQITEQSLADEDKITFRAMAKQLYADTVNLKRDAAEKRYHNLTAAYKRLRQTCHSCHRLFREKR